MLGANAKWIWINDTPKPNEYAIFEDAFTQNGKQIVFEIAAETDYVLTVNGHLAGFGQFAGYPFEKYYDSLDITPFCHAGRNELTITVRYEGVNSATHIDDGAGVIFSLKVDGKEQLYSSRHTLGGYDDRYLQHQTRAITSQLGLTSGMRSAVSHADMPCLELTKSANLVPRPVCKTQPEAFVAGELIDRQKRLYDLGREEAGYLYVQVQAKQACQMKIVYGEHIADGAVRYQIGKRDFSLDFELTEGKQEFLQLFVRVAGRYLQIFLPETAQILSIGLIPYRYPLTEKAHSLQGLDKAIYETCVRTLRLCMNTHYEDCPWREQALYILDSRNQMLCGYHAFEETAFQRANLVFMAKGSRKDGYLELTYPAVNTPAIPFFSVMYPVAVYEYVKHTNDTGILKDTFPTMYRIMQNLTERMDANGLIAELDRPFWNFYEWSAGSDGHNSCNRDSLLLNCAFVYSCTRFLELCQMAGVDFSADLSKTKRAIEKNFFHPESGLFALYDEPIPQYTQLGNAFALLIGLGDERTVTALKHDPTLIEATLSMRGFVYDALLLRDPEAMAYILNDIRKKYGAMLGAGATTFWETTKGESDFQNAGSLCHGWSAMPIHYYALFESQKSST